MHLEQKSYTPTAFGKLYTTAGEIMMRHHTWKRRGRISFSDAKGGGGGTKGFEVVLTLELEVLAILIREGWGRKKFPP